MGWVSPTGHNDPSEAWANEVRAYDENLGLWAQTSTTGAYLELTHAVLSCDKVRIYCWHEWKTVKSDPDIDIDIYYSEAWHNIFSGTVTKETWIEKEIGSTQNVTAARVKCNDTLGGFDIFDLAEFDFNEAAADVTIEVPLGTGSGQGFAPTMCLDSVIGIPLGVGSGQGFAPSIIAGQGVIISIPLGVGSGQGFAPTLSLGVSIAIPLGVGSGQGFAPRVLHGRLLDAVRNLPAIRNLPSVREQNPI